MRANVELAIIGAAIVYLAFFSWPVPSVVKDLYHSGVGRAVVLGSIVYLAKYQSIPIAILLAIYYGKACSAAYREAFEVPKEDKKKEEKKKEGEHKPPPPAVPGNVTTAPPSGGATASPSSSGTTEHYMNFSTF